ARRSCFRRHRAARRRLHRYLSGQGHCRVQALAVVVPATLRRRRRSPTSSLPPRSRRSPLPSRSPKPRSVPSEPPLHSQSFRVCSFFYSQIHDYVGLRESPFILEYASALTLSTCEALETPIDSDPTSGGRRGRKNTSRLSAPSHPCAQLQSPLPIATSTQARK